MVKQLEEAKQLVEEKQLEEAKQLEKAKQLEEKKQVEIEEDKIKYIEKEKTNHGNNNFDINYIKNIPANCNFTYYFPIKSLVSALYSYQ